MKKIVLPKWAVVNTIGGGRLIHIGNGEFVSADAQTPKVLEFAVPNLTSQENLPADLVASDAPYYAELSWELGSVKVTAPEPEADAPDTETTA